MQIFAIIGLIAITIAIFIRSDKFIDEKLMIVGGISLMIYCILIEDWILTILQIVFVIAGVVDLIRQRKRKLRK